jgi:hypothetical protein
MSERAFPKYVAALDKVLPLVHVFSTPYFWLSSDNLLPTNVDCRANQHTLMQIWNYKYSGPVVILGSTLLPIYNWRNIPISTCLDPVTM